MATNSLITFKVGDDTRVVLDLKEVVYYERRGNVLSFLWKSGMRDKFTFPDEQTSLKLEATFLRYWEFANDNKAATA